MFKNSTRGMEINKQQFRLVVLMRKLNKEKTHLKIQPP